MGEVSVFIAFTAGILSFLSPCVLPIVPGYLSYLSGVAGAQAQPKGFNFKVFLASILFVLGFSLVFTLLGASATTVGQFLRSYQDLIAKVGGGVVVFFGLHFAGAFLRPNFLREILGFSALLVALYLFSAISQKLLFDLLGIVLIVLFLYAFGVHEKLYAQKRLEVKTGGVPIFGAFLVGTLFAFGWSPCIGPVLGSILLYASQQETATQGAMLLFSYSMGLGIPFVVAGGLLSLFLGFVRSFGRFFGVVEFVGGLALIILGVLLTTGYLSLLANLSF